MKRIVLCLLVFLLLLTACASEPDRKGDRSRKEREKETFTLLDDSGAYPLYYYNYTRDYEFDQFLSRGGAADTEALVSYCLELFPDMELTLNGLGYGCSSYCALDADGEVFFGRNFDMDAANTGAYMVVHTDPKGGYESYSTVNLGFLGIRAPEDPVGDDTSALLLAPYIPLDGINSEGVAICVLQLNTAPIFCEGGKVALTPTTIIRSVLDNAADLEEALEIFEEASFYTEGYAYHFMIADRKGNCAVVEYVDNEMVVVPMEDQPLACANAHISQEGREFYRVYDHNESDRRVEAILGGITENMNTDSAMEALSKAWVGGTRWSIVYELTDCELHMTVNRDDMIYSFAFDGSIKKVPAT